MKMKRIANHVALQTVGYVISGKTWVQIYIRDMGYKRRDIYKGPFEDFYRDHLLTYANCQITELAADENVLNIGISE